MSKESQARINRYATALEDGDYRNAIAMMVADDMDYAGIKDFCYSINYYPNAEFLEYLQDVLAHKENKEVLDNFFSKVKI